MFRDISRKLPSYREVPPWKQETGPVLFILGDEMPTFIQNGVTKYNEDKHTTYFKVYTTTQNNEKHNCLN